MAKQAVAYIRKSVLHRGSRTVSPQVQEEEVRRVAERYGDTDLLVLGDLGKSGRKTERRPEYQQLLGMIEAGQVKAVYAYSMSRLSRSVKDYAALSELCVERKVPVRLVKEGEQDYTTSTGRLIAGLLSHVAALVADVASEHAKESIAAKTANGDHHGEQPYGFYAVRTAIKDKDGNVLAYRGPESLNAVIEAFRDAGSYHGAARVLNANGTPTRRGQPWRSSTVRLLVTKYRPDVVPRGQIQRVKSQPKFLLARLLTCPCGRTLTGVNQKGHPRYVCTTAFDGNQHHWPKSVSESQILDWVKAEAARFSVPSEVVAEDEAAGRDDLDRRLDNLSRQHEMGLLTDAALAERVAEVQQALEKLDTLKVLRTVPVLDWEWPTQEVNAFLRTIWNSVQLGPDMRPVRADWTDLTMRAD